MKKLLVFQLSVLVVLTFTNCTNPKPSLTKILEQRTDTSQTKFIPGAAGITPGYWCTWLAQNFAVDTFTLNYVIGLGDHTVSSDNLTEKVIFGSSGWEKQFPENTCFMPSASPKPIPLKGLDSGKNYTVKEINLYPGVRSSIGAEKKNLFR